MTTPTSFRTDWRRAAARFFFALLVLVSLFAATDAPNPESAVIGLAVVLPIAWITLRDARYSRTVWSVAVVIPVVVWIARAVIV